MESVEIVFVELLKIFKSQVLSDRLFKENWKKYFNSSNNHQTSDVVLWFGFGLFY